MRRLNGQRPACSREGIARGIAVSAHAPLAWAVAVDALVTVRHEFNDHEPLCYLAEGVHATLPQARVTGKHAVARSARGAGSGGAYGQRQQQANQKNGQWHRL